MLSELPLSASALSQRSRTNMAASSLAYVKERKQFDAGMIAFDFEQTIASSQCKLTYKTSSFCN